MTDFKKDMARIQALVGDAFSTTGGLVALSDGGVMSEQKLQMTLEQTAAEFEKAALELRTLCEKHSPGKGGYGKRPPAPFCAIDGRVEKLGYNWLHIQLNTLLPHCRYQTPLWLTDTIRRLLDNFEAGGNTVPYFRERAMLVIDEHSEVSGRRVFDQDNKGWKAVCNALKGRAIPDDDQYTLAVSLLATPSAENICHITLMALRDASDFFALHSGDYALGSIYGRTGPIR